MEEIRGRQVIEMQYESEKERREREVKELRHKLDLDVREFLKELGDSVGSERNRRVEQLEEQINESQMCIAEREEILVWDGILRR